MLKTPQAKYCCYPQVPIMQSIHNCCSADPEREITGEDYSDYIDSYVEVEYGDDKTIMGQLVEVNNEGLSIKVNNKGRIKVTEINFAAINKISLRIKI